jgi:hypothetical protein
VQKVNAILGCGVVEQRKKRTDENFTFHDPTAPDIPSGIW